VEWFESFERLVILRVDELLYCTLQEETRIAEINGLFATKILAFAKATL
jgi:hypothetical protein